MQTCRMKILFLINNTSFGGGSYSLFKLAEALSKRGHKIYISSARMPDFLHLEPKNRLRIKTRGIIPFCRKGYGYINKTWLKLWDRTLVASLVKREIFDWIIGQQTLDAVEAHKIGKRYNIKIGNFVYEAPVLLSERSSSYWDNWSSTNGRLKGEWDEFKNALVESDAIFAISNLMKNKIVGWINKEIDEVIYPGLNVYDSVDIIKTKKQNQILFIGRLVKSKNVAEIINALTMVEDPPRFVVCGTGEEEANLRRMGNRLRIDCRFIRDLSDSEKWLEIRKSLFMVFPTSLEGFGMPPGEALMCGIPCIASDIPILREVYRNNLIYFREHDTYDLADKINLLLVKIRNGNFSITDKRGFLKQYSWDCSAEKIESVLSKKLKVG